MKNNINYGEINELYNEVEKIINKFLENNGGYRNGYDTYIKAAINAQPMIVWHTPSWKSITQEEHNRLGDELLCRLVEISRSWGYYFVIQANADIHGVYTMTIKAYTPEKIINLNWR